MDYEFWQTRWDNDQIGFHQNDVNSHLRDYWHRYVSQDARVLVPLCGKSLDLLWLSQQGHEVIGVEFSEKAIVDFFKENALNASQRDIHGLMAWRYQNLTLYHADFFQVTRKHLGTIDAVYDRAALIALPAQTRADYSQHVLGLTDHAPQMLITLEYDQAEMDGPPFAVNTEEVERHYQTQYDIRILEQIDALAAAPHLAEKGLSALTETLYWLSPR